MNPINRQLFMKGLFNLHRERVKPITQKMVDTLEPRINDLLSFMEADATLVDSRHAAYILATVYHETAATMSPLSEYGKGKGRIYGRPVSYTINGIRYVNVFYGRGYVQLTWFNNYLRMAKRLNDWHIVTHPETTKEPETAYKILSVGMFEGMFAKGQTLNRHINGTKTDYVNARRIVNGVDKANLIAGYARKFEKIIKGAQ
jgi:putative chitinase